MVMLCAVEKRAGHLQLEHLSCYAVRALCSCTELCASWQDRFRSRAEADEDPLPTHQVGTAVQDVSVFTGLEPKR